MNNEIANEYEKSCAGTAEIIPYPIQVTIKMKKMGFGEFEREVIVYKDWEEVYRRVLDFAKEIQRG